MPDTPLKPCPFCGSAKLTVFKNAVVCAVCSGSGPDLGDTDDKPSAIAEWNNRPSEWHPIQTAPKDGTHILVCHGAYDRHWTFNQHPPCVVHWWNGYRDEPAGFYLSQNSGEYPQPCDWWQPLPSTPISQNAQPSAALATRANTHERTAL